MEHSTHGCEVGVLRVVVLVDPMSYVVDAVRGLCIGPHHFPIALDVAVALAAALTFGALARQSFNKMEDAALVRGRDVPRSSGRPCEVGDDQRCRDLGDEPWAESRRRKALEDVLDGPADWTNTAAVIAILDVGRRDERARPSVLNALLRCARRAVAPAAYQHAIRPAALAVLELPGVGQDVLKEMKGITKQERTR